MERMRFYMVDVKFRVRAHDSDTYWVKYRLGLHVADGIDVVDFAKSKASALFGLSKDGVIVEGVVSDVVSVDLTWSQI